MHECMHREMEFRGKRKDDGEWVYGCLVEDETSCVIVRKFEPYGCEYGWGMEGDEVIPETVGQLAKRLGMNGEKAYEDDIVRWTSLYIEGVAVGELTFFDGSWFIQGEKQNGLLDDCLSCEVIGNIHDNPDLLVD